MLAGEWRELSGGGFEIVEPAADGAAAETDLLIFSPVQLGELCEEGALRPVRDSTLASDALAFDDFYPAVRDQLLRYGGRTMALPIGCVTPVVATTSEEPVQWDAVGYFPFVTRESPSGMPRPAWQLLARAAPLAVDDLRESVLFNPETMAPAIESPPFVAALAQLVDAAQLKAGPTTAALRTPFRDGVLSDEPAVWTHAQTPPGAPRRYDAVRSDWVSVSGPPRRVSLVGVDGRLIGVTAGSRNAAAAFRLAAWLAGKSNARQLSVAGPHVANVRRSLSRSSDNWLGIGGAGLGREVALAADQSWQSEHQLPVPRLIEAERYLAVLDEAVKQAAGGSASPEDALRRASERWDELTDEVGRERQRRCYLRHLGLDQYAPPKR
ncbi:hypothetical protein KOR34_11610 [Posidoniimonas corsicana]|uniref:Bacterial extracellular solute-binding protein n=1 Tax=Posidoniimonas corsicana TaxID=1938618 RepID=A0A5C5VE74_9BACT|nr:hypothetical protein KOR34_11610 [Posidoniimonas corsicana]